MNRWWHLRREYFDADDCQAILAHGLQLPSEEAQVGFDPPRVDHSFRHAKIRWLRRDDPIVRHVFYRLDDACKEASLLSFGFDVLLCREMQLVEFPAGGHYVWHNDINWLGNHPGQRKLSVVVPLSHPTGYTGGQLELAEKPAPDAEQLRQQGSVLIFPAFLQQRTMPVTQGTCYTLVTWCEGPCFR